MALRDWIPFLRHREPIQASISSAPELADFLSTVLGGPASSGVAVTPASAMTQATVATALKVLGESVAQLPFKVYREDVAGVREEVKNHRLVQLMGARGKPNGWQTPFRFREQMTRDMGLRGNAYAFRVTVRGQLRELVPIQPHRVKVAQGDDMRLTYEIRMSKGEPRTFAAEDIFHLVGPSSNGFAGDDIVYQMRDVIGLALAQDKDTARMFSNGARLGGVLETDASLTEPALKRLKESFDAIYSGVDNAHKTAILEQGLKFSKVAMTAEEAQALESRKHTRSIISAIWRIPPHMVGDLEKSTFSNIENLARQFVDYALVPWLERWEQETGCQLLTDLERRQGYYIELDTSRLLRGDSKTRAEFYSKMITARVMNPNEARAEENRPPYPGGDEFLNPAIEPRENDDAEETVDEPSAPRNPDDA